MASGGSQSEYIQFKPKGAGVTLYFTPEFMQKNQRPSQVNDLWYISAVLTGKTDFGAHIAQLERSGIITDT